MLIVRVYKNYFKDLGGTIFKQILGPYNTIDQILLCTSLGTQRLSRVLIVTPAVYPHFVVNYDCRQLGQWVPKLWSDKETDRQTDIIYNIYIRAFDSQTGMALIYKTLIYWYTYAFISICVEI